MKRNQFDLIAQYQEKGQISKYRLEYQQQGNRSNLKIHFFRLRGVLRGVKEIFVREKKYVLGILKL